MAKANMLVDEALAEVRKIRRYLEWAALTVLLALGAGRWLAIRRHVGLRWRRSQTSRTRGTGLTR